MTMPPDAPPDTGGVVAALAGWLAQDSFGTGPLAALRRLDPAGSLATPALQRLLAQAVPDDWLGLQGMRDWALIVHMLALGAPDLHRGGTRFGTALHAANYSESRLLRLLEADRAALDVLLPRTVRFLVAKGEKLDPAGLARFVLAISRAGSRPDRAEDERTGIARAYYRAERDSTASSPSPAAGQPA